MEIPVNEDQQDQARLNWAIDGVTDTIGGISPELQQPVYLSGSGTVRWEPKPNGQQPIEEIFQLKSKILARGSCCLAEIKDAWDEAFLPYLS